MATHVGIDGGLLTELAQGHGGPVDEAVRDAVLLHISMDNADEMLEHIHESRGLTMEGEHGDD